MDICSKLGGILREFGGNPGEIPHIEWKTLGVFIVQHVGCIVETIYIINMSDQMR